MKFAPFYTLLFSVWFLANLPAQVGEAFTYQGRLADGATPIETVVDLRFRLYDSETSGTQIGSSVEFLNTTYDGGIVQRDLDFGTGVFNGDPRWLQIELANPAGDAYTTLTPRIQILPSPYAMYAETTGSALNDADTSSTNELNTSLTLNGMDLELEDAGGVLSADLSPLVGSVFGDGHSLDAVDGAPTNAVFVNAEGNVGVGTTSPGEKLTVRDGSILQRPGDPLSVGRFIDDGTTLLGGAGSIYVSGDYAYVAASFEDAVQILDISDPTNPVAVGSIVDSSATELNGANSIFVSGDYAYVSASADNGVQVLDVSDPTNPVAVGRLQNASGITLDRPRWIFVSGNYAYVTSPFDSAVQIIDISDPTNPTALGNITDTGATRLQGAFSIYVQGNYAYVTADAEGGMQILDVSDPTNPVALGGLADDNSTLLASPRSIYVVGKHAYIGDSEGVQVIDVSDPNNPTAVGNIADNNNRALSSCESIFVAGNYAYVTGQFDNGVEVLDVSNPSNPRSAGRITDNATTALTGPASVFVVGNYAYVASQFNNAVEVLDISGIIAPSANIGSVAAGVLHVDTHAQFDNNVNIHSALNVGTDALIGRDLAVSGSITGNGSQLSGLPDQSATNELNTGLALNGMNLELTDAGGTLITDLSPLAGSVFGDGHSLDAVDGDPVDALIVDSEGRVGIGESSPQADLHVRGSIITGANNNNTITGSNVAALGSNQATVDGNVSAIVGGSRNTITANQSVILGGLRNTVNDFSSGIIGGQDNLSSNTLAMIVGGQENSNLGDAAAILGGFDNDITGGTFAALITGRRNEITDGNYNVIVGGRNNTLSASNSVILAGRDNTVHATESIAGGENAVLTETADNSFLWTDGTGTTVTQSQSFVITATNGVGINTDMPAAPLDVHGNIEFGGAGSPYTPVGTVSANPMQIIAGRVDLDGNELAGGTPDEYTVVRNSTGNYTITYTTAFPAIPVVTVTARDASNDRYAYIRTSAAGSFTIQITNPTGNERNADFDFTVLGAR
jgi:hypothetical protein